MLNEMIGLGKIIDELLVVHIIYLDREMSVASDQILVDGPINHRYDMRDVCCFQSISSPEGNEAVASGKLELKPRGRGSVAILHTLLCRR